MAEAFWVGYTDTVSGHSRSSGITTLLGESHASWVGLGGLGVVDAEDRETVLVEPALDGGVSGLLEAGGEEGPSCRKSPSKAAPSAARLTA